MMKPLVLALALVAAAGVQAQTTAAAAPAASAALPTSPAKKALVAKILKLQQPGIEALARQLTEQPAMQLLQSAGPAVDRLPADRRESVAKDLQADARKYVADTMPGVRDTAVRLAPSTVGVILESRMTEAELKEVLTVLESPANRKFQSLASDMQRALAEKLVAETRPTVEPQVRALQQTMAQQLEAANAPAAPATPAASGAKR
jgi:hypothetical protein